jgi:hypothetical protein
VPATLGGILNFKVVGDVAMNLMNSLFIIIPKAEDYRGIMKDTGILTKIGYRFSVQFLH